MIRLEDTVKTYRIGEVDVCALRGVSLEIERGGFWAIMGPSGSGKSTLMNLIGCLDRPTSGRYWLDGTNVEDLEDDELSAYRLRHLGFVFQSFNLIPQLTVRENIELPMYYRGVGPAESAARAEELAELVGLADRLSHRPSELSGGQCQRVAIARALANDPPVILADEPTGNLDSRTGEQIMDILVGLHREGRTVILVTHELRVAGFAQRRLWLKDGAIERIEGGPV
ncbi:MAG: ABC transporter ATP-binding protein [Verrucomicrobia bacterium]|nr:ABC transporter ATP-binding protein [Verrucomicrobiota bacterium]